MAGAFGVPFLGYWGEKIVAEESREYLILELVPLKVKNIFQPHPLDGVFVPLTLVLFIWDSPTGSINKHFLSFYQSAIDLFFS